MPHKRREKAFFFFYNYVLEYDDSDHGDKVWVFKGAVGKVTSGSIH